MAIGRIPWSAAMQYAREELELPTNMLRPFWVIVSSLDDGYRSWQKSEHDRYVRNNAPKRAASKGGRETYQR